MRTLLMTLVTTTLLFIGGRLEGAEASISHSMILKSGYAKVVATMALKRPNLVVATGARITETKGNLFKISADRADFWIRETKEQVTPSRLVVTWRLVGKNRDVRAYKSVIDCYTSPKGTVVRGTIQASVGEGMLGSRRLDDHINRGVEQMQGELKRLLGEEARP